MRKQKILAIIKENICQQWNFCNILKFLVLYKGHLMNYDI